MSDSDKLVWVQQVIQALERYLASANPPVLDVEWLLLRCRDILEMAGDLHDASLRQLRVDVDRFCREFPDLLPNDIRPTRLE